MIRREGDYLLHMECQRPKLSSASGWNVQQDKAEAPPFRGSGITSSSSSSSSARAREGERAPSDHHHHNFTAKGKGKGGITASSPPWRPDDKDGHYTFALGDNLTPRYKILSKMGEGTFGQVLECWDRQTKQFVAVKIVRGLQKYREAAMIEIDVLSKVAKHDRSGTRCVQMLNWFDYRNHICIVFEKLGPSLYDFLRKNSYRPFPIDLVRDFGRQLLELFPFSLEASLQLLWICLSDSPSNMCSVYSRHAAKYFRHRTRLDWPEGASSRESIRAVRKLLHLPDLIMRHVDKSSLLFIDLLEGLLRFEPRERLTASEALRHRFFTEN